MSITHLTRRHSGGAGGVFGDQCPISSRTKHPSNTTRPLCLRFGSSSGSSWFFSTQMSKILPTWIFSPSFRALAATSCHSWTVDKSQHPCEVNLSHSFWRAALALAFPACSFLLTGLATQVYKGGKAPELFGRCERDNSP